MGCRTGLTRSIYAKKGRAIHGMLPEHGVNLHQLMTAGFE